MGLICKRKYGFADWILFSLNEMRKCWFNNLASPRGVEREHVFTYNIFYVFSIQNKHWLQDFYVYSVRGGVNAGQHWLEIQEFISVFEEQLFSPTPTKAILLLSLDSGVSPALCLPLTGATSESENLCWGQRRNWVWLHPNQKKYEK